MARGRKSRRSSSRSRGFFGMGGGTNKLIMAAAVGAGAAIIVPKVVQGLDPKVSAALGGFAVGGPIGAAVGYFAGPAIGSAVQGASSTSNMKQYGSYF